VRISIFGSGYVGLVQAAVFSEVGHDVICMDIDRDRIARIQNDDIPFFEPGLSGLLQAGLTQQRLRFTTNSQDAVENSDYLFVCVGTPSLPDGSADLQAVIAVATDIAKHMTSRKVIVNKSTVPVGTADQVHRCIADGLAARQISIPFEVCSNPEFLKEGSALADALKPDRIIVGARSEETVAEFRRLYESFNRNHDKMMFMDPRSAELTKYASNAMLATKISFINEIANIAEAVGADIESVRQGMGSDSRIGFQFIYPGIGYGGSCFPKDVRALDHLAKERGTGAQLLSAVHTTNERQKQKLSDRILSRLGPDLTGRTVAVWGLAFKPNTDDMREAPSRVLMEAIWAAGGRVVAFDPEAMDNCRTIYGERDDLRYAENKEAALDGADCLAICTEWKAFRSPDFEGIKQRLTSALIFDGRNLYDPQYMAALEIEYYAIGRGRSVQSSD
jgi:UDPglucose 6-dehydrogenase